MSTIRRGQHTSTMPYLWILPALAFVAWLKFYPIFFSVILSLFEWNIFEYAYGPGPFTKFLGLGNYNLLLQDPGFIRACVQTLVYAVATITVQLGIAYILAVFVYLGKFSRSIELRATIFFPCLLSGVLVGNVSRKVMFLRGGIIYQVTNALGLPDIYLLPEYAFHIVVFLGLWQFIGFYLLIFYAGLQSVDNEIMEAASVDGAGFWRMLFYIITPMQLRTMMLAAMLGIIFSVHLFDLPRTVGASTLPTYLANIAFGSRLGGPLGYASAIATVMIGILVIFAWLRSRVLKSIDW